MKKHYSKFGSLLILGFLLFSGLPLIAMADTAQDYDLARSAMRQEDWEAANFEWRHILETDPQSQEATIGLAQSLFHTHFDAEAAGLLEGIPLERRSMTAELGLARIYADMQNYDKSKDSYLRLLSKQPFEPTLFRELYNEVPHLSDTDQKNINALMNNLAKQAKTKGDDAINQGHYSEAASYYALPALQFHTIGLLNDYGILLLLTHQYQDAHDQFSTLNRKGKLSFSQVQSNAAITALSIGRYAEAKADILLGIQTTQDPALKAKLYNNLGFILETSRKRQDAKYAYQHALSLDPDLTMAQLNLASVEQADREYAEAVKNYQDMLRRNPNQPELWNRLGFTYELLVKSRSAVSAYEKAISIDPSFLDSYYNLTILYKKMHKLQQADETLRRLAEVGYSHIENPNEKPVTSASSEKDKSLTKYVTLFSANPKITPSSSS